MTTSSQPTDDLLRSSVLQALAEDERTAGMGLRVGVLNGVVHLGGDVPSETLRDLVESVSGGIIGVRGVVNRVRAPGGPEPSRTVDVSLFEVPRRTG